MPESSPALRERGSAAHAMCSGGRENYGRSSTRFTRCESLLARRAAALSDSVWPEVPFSDADCHVGVGTLWGVPCGASVTRSVVQYDAWRSYWSVMGGAWAHIIL